MNRQQQLVIEYLLEERRILIEHACGTRKLRFNGQQRRRLATKAKAIGRKGLEKLGTIVTPDTLTR